MVCINTGQRIVTKCLNYRYLVIFLDLLLFIAPNNILFHGIMNLWALGHLYMFMSPRYNIFRYIKREEVMAKSLQSIDSSSYIKLEREREREIMGKGRAPCCDKSQVKRGPWSPAEDLRLIAFIQKHGHENWRALPKQAGQNLLSPSPSPSRSLFLIMENIHHAFLNIVLIVYLT